MEPLLLLLAGFIISLLLLYRQRKQWQLQRACRIGLAVMFVFTGLSHFIYTRGMVMMLPPEVPYRPLIVYSTGIAELAFAAGIFTPYKKLTGLLCMVFLVAIFPSNIYAVCHQVNITTARYDGEGLASLWYRIPVQLILIGCVYLALIKNYGRTLGHINTNAAKCKK